MSVCVLICVYTHINPYICFMIYICIKINISSLMSSTPFHYRVNHSTLLPLLICNFPLQQWETWLSLSSVNLFNFSIPVHIYRGYCEMKISPVILVNKKCYSRQRFLASKCEWGLSKQDPADAAPTSWCLLRSWRPRGVHLPIHRMLNFLTPYLIFDVLQTACSLRCKLVYSLTCPLPPGSSLFRATEMLPPGVLNIPTK